MFTLLINGLPAILKTGTNIKITRENPFFSKAGTFSLDVSLPLEGCVENQRIFGALHRPDFPKLTKEKQKFAFHLIAPPLDLKGRAVVTQVSQEEIKVQLLAGNSETKYSLVDERGGDVYIDTLDLGRAWDDVPQLAEFYKTYIKKGRYYELELDLRLRQLFETMPRRAENLLHGLQNETSAVAFPILSTADNQKSNEHWLFEGVFALKPTLYASNGLRLAAQPYLCVVAERILRALGYEVVRNDLKNSWMRNIFVANARLTTEIAKTLPHWTANEFFTELRNFTGHWLSFNGAQVEICAPLAAVSSGRPNTELEEVVDEMQYDYEETPAANGLLLSNVDYSWSSENRWLRVPDEVWNAAKILDATGQETIHVEDLQPLSKWLVVDRNQRSVLVYIPTGKSGQYVPERVDQLAPLIRRGEQYGPNGRGVDVTLKIVPVEMSWTPSIFEPAVNSTLRYNLPTLTTAQKRAYSETETFNVFQSIIGNSDVPKEEERPDTMEVALNTADFYEPTEAYMKGQAVPVPFGTGWLRWPNDTAKDFVYRQIPMRANTFKNQFCLANPESPSIGADALLAVDAPINRQTEVCFSFLDKKNISPLDVFLIKGRRYLCSKIEMQVSEEGLLPLKRGYFYELS